MGSQRLLDHFHLNGHASLEFHPQAQKLRTTVYSKYCRQIAGR